MGDYSGISFAGWGQLPKSGIGHIRTSSYGLGDMFFAINNVMDGNPVTIGNEVMRITRYGNV
jgi:hypothetical protein